MAVRWLSSPVVQKAEWREEVKHHFDKIKSEGTCLHRLDEELVKRRREELRSGTGLGSGSRGGAGVHTAK